MDSKRVGDTRSMTTLWARDDMGARDCHLASHLSIVVGTNTRYTEDIEIINFKNNGSTLPIHEAFGYILELQFINKI